MRHNEMLSEHGDLHTRGGTTEGVESGVWANNAQAGPSRLRDSILNIGTPSTQARGVKRTRRRRRSITPIHAIESDSTQRTTSPRPPRKPGAIPLAPLLILPFLAPLVPLAHAAPALPVAPTPTLNPPIAPRGDSPLVYITSVITPTHLPEETITVPASVLPYILAKDSEGRWEKVDSAWSLYGRQAGSNGGVLIGGDPDSMPSFVVESSLPRGWGQQSNRTNFYQVPLIAVASVILAVAIVVGIIILVLNRRKTQRKAKRRAERQRRKALLAAGIDPSTIDGANQEAVMKERLLELEKQHKQKKRKEGGAVFARVKVKKWTKGLRRRKGGGSDDGDPRIEVIEEEDGAEHKPGDGSGEHDQRPASLHTISDVMAGDTTEGPTDGSGSSPEPDTGPNTSIESGQPGSSSAPYFPPAYRPASVRSYRAQEPAGPSRRRTSHNEPPPPSVPEDQGRASVGTEKTRAPGYYPAPATEESEAALAVVSRAEGKSRMPADQVEEEEAERERIRHIATDDKRVLEQMRLGGSAPSEPPSAPAEGPSAPQVEVDQDGFERHDLDTQDEPSSPGPAAQIHPDIPAPPRLPSQRLDSTSPSAPTHELHLVPSAPPAVPETEASAPSAPPPLDTEDEEPSTAPSAPAFEIGPEGDDGELESELHHPVEQNQSAAGPESPAIRPQRPFLPTYQP